ncbi:phosphoribosyl-AMP cyclohydrolase [Candidatus Daviesbacteria bacterium]|nr:phosphoribosyl-AMP cyclohydrolase [Candidatus Daviesbacteria bacterium]
MEIDFKKGDGLVPVIIQDYLSGQVLMLGFMNKQAFEKTKSTKLVNFYSRSRQKLWMKGEQSGNKLEVKEVFTDCDNDSILIKVNLVGNAVCHTGEKTCFFKKL